MWHPKHLRLHLLHPLSPLLYIYVSQSALLFHLHDLRKTNTSEHVVIIIRISPQQQRCTLRNVSCVTVTPFRRHLTRFPSNGFYPFGNFDFIQCVGLLVVSRFHELISRPDPHLKPRTLLTLVSHTPTCMPDPVIPTFFFLIFYIIQYRWMSYTIGFFNDQPKSKRDVDGSFTGSITRKEFYKSSVLSLQTFNIINNLVSSARIKNFKIIHSYKLLFKSRYQLPPNTSHPSQKLRFCLFLFSNSPFTSRPIFAITSRQPQRHLYSLASTPVYSPASVPASVPATIPASAHL